MKFNLNPQQKLAVQAADKPLLIVAGAGTGKTRTLTGRLAYLMENGVSPNRIVAMTFTNKAAKEMAGRVHNAKIANTLCECRENFSHNSRPVSHHSHYAFPFIGTFHSFGARILRAEAELLGRNGNFVIFDNSDSLQIVKKLFKSESFRNKDSDYSGAAEICRKISRIKNGIVSLGSMKNSSPEDILALKIFRRYEKELQKNNAFDFDDLIEKVVKIFRENSKVLEKYRGRFHHILIDEYQDLNNKQYELVKLLVGASSRISVVGDDQQMIYSFRGSNFQIFLDFEKDWPDANVVLLEENYRSAAKIVKAASALIANNENQKPKTLWTKKEDGAPVKIVETSDEESEADWIAEQIQIMTNDNNDDNKTSVIGHGRHHGANVAVLYRTNAQSRAIEQTLIERGIPYQIFGGLRFYERKEIKDVVAALRYAQNPNDEISRERLEKNIAKGRFSRFRESLDGDNFSSPTELIRDFLDSTDYLELVGRNFLNADERRENIAELLHFASEFKDLPSFLEQITLLQPTDSPSQVFRKKNLGGQAVSLMTIHLAKGLEFDSVFLAGCNEGLLPHNRSLGNGTETEEERRLMYVAMTRAKEELFISFYDIPSRFLGELPQELVEFESLVSGGKDFSDLDSEERYITLD
ncbi:MAG: UvrD-helicase domain-containing protein [Patescibacteria group bacterium]